MTELQLLLVIQVIQCFYFIQLAVKKYSSDAKSTCDHPLDKMKITIDKSGVHPRSKYMCDCGVVVTHAVTKAAKNG